MKIISFSDTDEVAEAVERYATRQGVKKAEVVRVLFRRGVEAERPKTDEIADAIEGLGAFAELRRAGYVEQAWHRQRIDDLHRARMALNLAESYAQEAADFGHADPERADQLERLYEPLIEEATRTINVLAREHADKEAQPVEDAIATVEDFMAAAKDARLYTMTVEWDRAPDATEVFVCFRDMQTGYPAMHAAAHGLYNFVKDPRQVKLRVAVEHLPEISRRLRALAGQEV